MLSGVHGEADDLDSLGFERLRTGVRFIIGVYERSVPILRAFHEAAARDENGAIAIGSVRR